MLPNGAVSPCFQVDERQLKMARQMMTSFWRGKLRPLRVVFGLKVSLRRFFAPSARCEAPPEGKVGEIVATTIGIRATLLRIAQRRSQPGDPLGRNGFEARRCQRGAISD